jgi:hypothetical protein
MVYPTTPKWRFLPTLCLLALLLVACQTEPAPAASPSPTATAVPTLPTVLQPAAPATVPATMPPQPSPSPTPASLLAETMTLLQPFLAETGQALAVTPLASETMVWAAYTVGDSAEHRLWLVGREPAGLTILAETGLTTFSILLPDQLHEVQVSPAGIWLELSGPAAATDDNCYQLLHYQNGTISANLTHCHPLLASEGITDLNSDGVADLALNESVLLCPGCGIIQPAYRLLSWTDVGWVEIRLQAHVASTDTALQAANQQMVALAEAGFWQAAAGLAATISRAEPVVAWNASLIEYHVATLQARLSSGTDVQQLFTHLFLGDYEATATLLRPYPPEELFTGQPEIFAGQPAEQLLSLSDVIVARADQALATDDQLAAAHFLRGWALYLADPSDPNALQAIEQADRLAPTDALFADSLFYFYNHLNYSQ